MEEARAAIRAGKDAWEFDEVVDRVCDKARKAERRETQRVINGTGIVLHTNLGRAPLSVLAAERLAAEASSYAALELDLETGRRGGRAAYAEEALGRLTGAESAVVVNNCAAAVMLVLAALKPADGAPFGVVLSRGELVEIGGGFRVPEVLEQSGATLIEVGTTNRTRLADYERAIERHAGAVAAILRVHQSNFRQVGFVERPRSQTLPFWRRKPAFRSSKTSAAAPCSTWPR